MHAGTCRQRRETSPSALSGSLCCVALTSTVHRAQGAILVCRHLKGATVHHCRPPRRLDDPKLCKNFLLGFCPGEEFQRTKHDYGTCALDHDEAAKAQVSHQCIFLDAVHACDACTSSRVP